MALLQRSMLKDGVVLTCIPTTKFKTSCLAFNFVLPLRAETAPYGALLPFVLRRGTEALPDMQRISARLEELYGTRIEPSVRKKGEALCFGFVCDGIDGAFTENSRPVFELISMVFDLIFHPAPENGGFVRDYVLSEKTNLLDRIDAQINDKRVYAVRKLHEIMCAGEPFAVSETGSRETASEITGEKLRDFYRYVLRSAPLEIYYSGGEDPEEVKSALLSALSGHEKKDLAVLPAVVHKTVGEPKAVTEEMSVSQGKLSMGFRTNTAVGDKDYPALLVANAVFGSGTSSKLFVNVREKMSLCYYASSTVEKIKGIMTVSSGIEAGKYETAKDEILRQFEDVKRGNVTQGELEAAVRMLKSILTAMADSHMQSEDYHLAQAVSGVFTDIPTLINAIESVGVPDVSAVFSKLKLDTVYLLRGNGGVSDEV